jgi:hypothetical protein
VSKTLRTPPVIFTLGEIRLLKSLYHELSLDELAILLRKSSKDITALVRELGLKREEVHNG